MNKTLTSATIETPLGTMTAVASEQALHFLHFPDTRDHTTLKGWMAEGRIQPQTTPHPCLDQLKKELEAYFAGKLKTFQTPLCTSGTQFQQQVWKALQTVPYGHTISYQTEARKIKRPTAYRAVANANGANPITLIIPCHRIIRHNGALGGYGAGIHRKQWLLDHEKACL